MSNVHITTKISTTYDNDNANDNDINIDAARRATEQPHDWRGPCLSPGGSAIQEAGVTPSGASVPAPGLVFRDVLDNTVLPAFQQPAACASYSTYAQPRSPVYCEQHMPRPPAVVGACKPFGSLSTINDEDSRRRKDRDLSKT